MPIILSNKFNILHAVNFFCQNMYDKKFDTVRKIAHFFFCQQRTKNSILYAAHLLPLFSICPPGCENVLAYIPLYEAPLARQRAPGHPPLDDESEAPRYRTSALKHILHTFSPVFWFQGSESFQAYITDFLPALPDNSFVVVP